MDTLEERQAEKPQAMYPGTPPPIPETSEGHANRRWPIGRYLLMLPVLLAGFFLAGLFLHSYLTAERDSAGALRNKGRGIWTAVMSYNLDSEKNTLQPTAWPGEITADGTGEPVQWDSAVQYFRYLLSDAKETGDPRQAIPTEDWELRLVSDLSLRLLAGGGIPEAPSAAAFDNRYCAWHVCVLRENAPSDAPFLISKNVHVENGRIVRTGDGSALVPLDAIKPFGTRRAVWITKGGGIFDARAKYLTHSILLGGTNAIDVLVCR